MPLQADQSWRLPHISGFIRDLIIPKPVLLLSLADPTALSSSFPPSYLRLGRPYWSPVMKRNQRGQLQRKPSWLRQETLQGGITNPMRRRVSWGIAQPRIPSLFIPRASNTPSQANNTSSSLVAQACLSIARMSRVVEKAHNSKTAEALLVRQHLEKASAEAINSMKDEIQGTILQLTCGRLKSGSLPMCPHERAKALQCPHWAPWLSVRWSHRKGQVKLAGHLR